MNTARNQHAHLKLENPNHLAVVRFNDQYLSYDDDAKILNSVLGIEIYETVDEEFNPDGFNTFFSAPRLEMFAEKLLAAGHKIVVLEAVGSVRLIEKEEEPTHYYNGFAYNEHGMCIDGMKTTFDIKVKHAHVKITVGENESGWSAGLDVAAKSSGYCFGIDENAYLIYDSSSKATLYAAYVALNWMRKEFNDTSTTSDTKKSINECIGKLCDFINGRVAPLSIEGLTIGKDIKSVNPLPPVPVTPVMPTQLQLL